MPKGHWPGRNWTPQEDARLAELLDAHSPYDEIAREIGRSRNAIIVRCNRHLGERLRYANGHTITKVAELVLGSHDNQKTVAWWCNNGWLAARASGLGQNIRVVEHDDLLAFLSDERYWHLWEPERITDRDLRDWALEIRRGLRFLTVGEVAERLCLTDRAVNRRIREGKLNAVRRGRGNWLIRSDWVVDTAPKPRAGQKARRFSPDEEERIRRAWGKQPMTRIAARMGRSTSSVYGAACRMGLVEVAS
jgi:excisionase family DNA binding protein